MAGSLIVVIITIISMMPFKVTVKSTRTSPTATTTITTTTIAMSTSTSTTVQYYWNRALKPKRFASVSELCIPSRALLEKQISETLPDLLELLA